MRTVAAAESYAKLIASMSGDCIINSLTLYCRETMVRIGLPSRACCVLLSLLGGVPAATRSDIARATRTRVSDRLSGSDAAEISAKINAALRAAQTPLRDCATLSLGDAEALVNLLADAADPDIGALYGAGDGRGRRGRARRPPPSSRDGFVAARDAACAEALLLWTHHLSEDARAELRPVVRLPTLPVFDEEIARALDPDAEDAYRKKFTCQTGACRGPVATMTFEDFGRPRHRRRDADRLGPCATTLARGGPLHRCRPRPASCGRDKFESF